MQKLRKRFYNTPVAQRTTFNELEVAKVSNWCANITGNLAGAKVIISNFLDAIDGVFGHYANSVPSSFLFQLRSLNLQLMARAAKQESLYICDVCGLAAAFGHVHALDHNNYVEADLAFSLDFLPALVKGVVDIIQAARGNAKKCLVLDLDNTLWGGVIGDDGIENIQIGELGQGKAFAELQYWARDLQRRGILLAVCSKNDEKIARSAFESHPDMLLSFDDIAIFVANWDSKVDNIRKIKSFLNIGYDTMVFLDDNPFERGVVKHHIPEITVPELPPEPSEYLPFIQSLNLFETTTYTEFDQERTAYFQQEFKREDAQKSFTDEREFLASLGMTCEIAVLSGFNLPRAAQLLQRSNQFNLRTVRHGEDELKRFSTDPAYRSWVFDARDKFGSYGIISVIIGRISEGALFLDSWVMSCRVLKRGIENLALNEIIRAAREAEIPTVLGQYIRTPKNALVEDHYRTLGFKDQGDGYWELAVEHYSAREHFIKVT